MCVKEMRFTRATPASIVSRGSVVATVVLDIASHWTHSQEVNFKKKCFV